MGNINQSNTLTNDKRQRFNAIFSRIANTSSSSKKPVHSSIDNSLLSTRLQLANPEDDEHRIRWVVNTGVTTNNINVQCYL